MTDKRFLQDGFDKKLAHFIEECGEAMAAMGDAVAAAGKIQRWGLNSVNPLLPVEQQETNRDWLIRALKKIRPELDDIDLVIARLEQDIHTEDRA